MPKDRRATTAPVDHDGVPLYRRQYGRAPHRPVISSGQPVVPTTAAQRGDLVFPDGEQHVVMWLGDGTIIHAPQTGDVVKRVPAYFTLASAKLCPAVCREMRPWTPRPLPPESMGPGNPVGPWTQGGTERRFSGRRQ